MFAKSLKSLLSIFFRSERFLCGVIYFMWFSSFLFLFDSAKKNCTFDSAHPSFGGFVSTIEVRISPEFLPISPMVFLTDGQRTGSGDKNKRGLPLELRKKHWIVTPVTDQPICTLVIVLIPAWCIYGGFPKSSGYPTIIQVMDEHDVVLKQPL